MAAIGGSSLRCEWRLQLCFSLSRIYHLADPRKLQDNPVGTGYSFVEDESSLVGTDAQAAQDLTFLLKELFNGSPNLQRSPLYIVAESYGGRFAVTLALSVIDAVSSGQLKLQLGGELLPFSL